MRGPLEAMTSKGFLFIQGRGVRGRFEILWPYLSLLAVGMCVCFKRLSHQLAPNDINNNKPYFL